MLRLSESGVVRQLNGCRAGHDIPYTCFYFFQKGTLNPCQRIDFTLEHFIKAKKNPALAHSQATGFFATPGRSNNN